MGTNGKGHMPSLQQSGAIQCAHYNFIKSKLLELYKLHKGILTRSMTYM